MSETKFQVAVVDDEESFARAIGRLLRAAGFEVVVYHSAEDFLQHHTDEPVNCLVLDIQMGGMSGLDLGRHMVARGARIPVVYVTALEDEGTSEEARRISGSALLHKPVSAQALIAAIHQAVHRIGEIKSS